MMTKKEKLEFATLVAEAVVKAMKATSETPKTANRGRKSAIPNEAPKTTKQKSAKALEEMVTAERAEIRKELASKKTAPKYSTKLTDYEPKKVDNNYIWGKKTDTIKSKHYMAMQKAYCYAVATKGQAITSDECYKMGIEVDFTEGGAYSKAKEQFKKKYVYIKKADR
jgi:hypothetical protein